MKVLLVGSGGREHALAWKLLQDDPTIELICAPGNAGIAEITDCIPVKATDIKGLAAFAERARVDLTVVGPEIPIEAGIVDLFQGAGRKIFGPTQNAARIETSKSFAKEIMRDAGVQTARATTHSDIDLAKAALREAGAPIVVKACGLAAGKGVVVAHSIEEAERAIEMMIGDRAFGDAGAEVLLEDYMEGEELSLFAITDGTNVVPLIGAQDHKRLLDDDLGPNTGGMGAYCPVSIATQSLVDEIVGTVFLPTLAGLRSRDSMFTGLLYAGLMITSDGPKVVEFNCRFGDPEAQVILPLLAGGLAECMASVARGQAPTALSLEPGLFAVTTVLAARGYPEVPVKGAEITIPESLPPDVTVFHAGTARDEDGTLRVVGGRVLNVTAVASSFEEAQAQSREAADAIQFDGKVFRRDIGWREAARLTSRV